MSDSSDSIYLGDGAYASLTEWGDVIITANHHDPIIATNDYGPHWRQGL